MYCQDLNQAEESWYLAGIISHGKGCALPGESSFYTRVSFYTQWINSVINEIEPRGLQADVHPRAYCPGGISCDHGNCIGEVYLCDFHNDCFDGEDEAHCKPRVVNGKIIYEYVGGQYGAGYTLRPPTTTSTTVAPTTKGNKQKSWQRSGGTNAQKNDGSFFLHSPVENNVVFKGLRSNFFYDGKVIVKICMYILVVSRPLFIACHEIRWCQGLQRRKFHLQECSSMYPFQASLRPQAGLY